MHSQFSSLDVAVLAVYFVAILGVGYGFRKKSSSVEGFTAANRSLPGWLTGLSILGTYVSSISFLAIPGKAYAADWNSFVFSLSLPLATLIAIRWFLPFYRNSTSVSAYEHLEERFGVWARTYASSCYLLTQMARMGTVMYLMALPLNVLLGWDIHYIIIGTGICVTAYTFLGGLVAVIWTDAIQTIILIVGALVCGAIMVFSLPGGVGELFAVAGESEKFSLGDYGFSLTESSFWVVLVYGLVINLQNFGIDQNYVQRYVASKSDAEARKSLWVGGATYLPVSAIFFFLGTALFAYYKAFPDLLPAAYFDPQHADKVFPHFIVAALPSGVTGLLIAAVFAAAMSTVSTSLNSSATIVLNDYYKRFRNPEADEASSMRFLHGTTIVWGILGTGMALAMTQVKSALDAWWSLAGIFGGGTLGLFLFGMIARQAKNAAAVAGVSVGVLLIVWMSLSLREGLLPEGVQSPFHSNLIIVFGTATILLVGGLVSLLIGKKTLK
ncbi:sodium:solute symporter [Pelagicoccus sp. SDUM812005]|uniref:sodium:solute symporter n=1 Tax=Pelagicoccus sp. SDUM812005 TaxID=3041257 RepID=UPI00280DEBE8|nr:sodium:solute symporter [Pelagicoccus sp. SDUM812005]MDQ8179405.1 sodium:solute symporter [Pelagicoccus sp. SDUM812005]